MVIILTHAHTYTPPSHLHSILTPQKEGGHRLNWFVYRSGQLYGEDVHQKDDHLLLGKQHDDGRFKGGRAFCLLNITIFPALQQQTHQQVSVLRIGNQKETENGRAVQSIGVAQQANVGGVLRQEAPQPAHSCRGMMYSMASTENPCVPRRKSVEKNSASAGKHQPGVALKEAVQPNAAVNPEEALCGKFSKVAVGDQGEADNPQAVHPVHPFQASQKEGGHRPDWPVHGSGQLYGEDVHQKDDHLLLDKQDNEGQFERGGTFSLLNIISSAFQQQTHQHVGVLRIGDEEEAKSGRAVQSIGVAQQANVGGVLRQKTPQPLLETASQLLRKDVQHRVNRKCMQTKEEERREDAPSGGEHQPGVNLKEAVQPNAAVHPKETFCRELPKVDELYVDENLLQKFETWSALAFEKHNFKVIVSDLAETDNPQAVHLVHPLQVEDVHRKEVRQPAPVVLVEVTGQKEDSVTSQKEGGHRPNWPVYGSGQLYGEDVHQKDDHLLLGKQHDEGQFERCRTFRLLNITIFPAFQEQTHQQVSVLRIGDQKEAENGSAVQSIGVAQQANVGSVLRQKAPQPVTRAEDVLLVASAFNLLQTGQHLPRNDIQHCVHRKSMRSSEEERRE
ncbi:hypothetical protein TYRP_022771 [Tyrophagus putrescentiae]|nr:hypothetical protein TYRP_022771 [Tyrophagus putrescentiae]